MTTQKISAWMGIAMALLGGPLKILRVMRQAEPWPFRIYDFIALALVLVGAILVLRGKGGRVLAAGWGFSIAMFYSSFFDHYEKWTSGHGDLAFEHTMVLWTGAFMALDIIGLALVLFPARAATD